MNILLIYTFTSISDTKYAKKNANSNMLTAIDFLNTSQSKHDILSYHIR